MFNTVIFMLLPILFVSLVASVESPSTLVPVTQDASQEKQYLFENYFTIQTKLVKDLFEDYRKEIPALYLSGESTIFCI